MNKLLSNLVWALFFTQAPLSQSPSNVAPSTSQILSPTFFGMLWNHNNSQPTIQYGAIRLWDVGATWADMEHTNGSFNWGALDARLAVANSKGVDVLYTFGKVPRWISSNLTQSCFSGTGCAAPPSDLASGDTAFKNFVTALVNHSIMSANGHIKYYELWNEPEQSRFWSGTPAQLVIMGNDAYTIIHSLDPSARVVGPSPGSYGYPQDVIRFLPAYLAAGGGPYMDIVGMHAYLSNPDKTEPQISDNILVSINLLKTLMAQYNLSNLPIFYTEGGWARANNGMSDNLKVAYLSQEYLLMWSNGVSRYYWYSWDNQSYGTLETGGVTQAAGIAYNLLYGWLVGATLTTPCSKAGDGTWTCNVTLANRSPGQIVWNGSLSKAYATGFTTYQTLDNATINPVVAGSVTINNKPILLN